MSDTPKRTNLMMPVSDQKAINLIEIEALRQITDNLRRLNDQSEAQTKMLHTMDKRLDRIEQNKLDRAVDQLQTRLSALEQEKFKRDGVVGAAEWLSKFGPWLLAFAMAVIAVMGWDRAS
jgi:hypothetical protein